MIQFFPSTLEYFGIMWSMWFTPSGLKNLNRFRTSTIPGQFITRTRAKYYDNTILLCYWYCIYLNTTTRIYHNIIIYLRHWIDEIKSNSAIENMIGLIVEEFNKFADDGQPVDNSHNSSVCWRLRYWFWWQHRWNLNILMCDLCIAILNYAIFICFKWISGHQFALSRRWLTSRI